MQFASPVQYMKQTPGTGAALTSRRCTSISPYWPPRGFVPPTLLPTWCRLLLFIAGNESSWATEAPAPIFSVQRSQLTPAGSHNDSKHHPAEFKQTLDDLTLLGQVLGVGCFQNKLRATNLLVLPSRGRHRPPRQNQPLEEDVRDTGHPQYVV